MSIVPTQRLLHRRCHPRWAKMAAGGMILSSAFLYCGGVACRHAWSKAHIRPAEPRAHQTIAAASPWSMRRRRGIHSLLHNGRRSVGYDSQFCRRIWSSFYCGTRWAKLGTRRTVAFAAREEGHRSVCTAEEFCSSQCQWGEVGGVP